MNKVKQSGLNHYQTLIGDPTDREAELMRIYEKWAATYDIDNDDELGTVSQPTTVHHFSQFVEKSARVLDVGCGTGLVGKALKDQGFLSVDGIDLSPAMLTYCAGRGYTNLFTGNLSLGLPVSDGQYQAAICVGVFTHGHVGTEGLDELRRIVAPGGIIAFSCNEGVFESMGFDQYLAQLSDDVLLVLERAPYMANQGVDAWYGVIKMAEQ